MYRAAAGSMDRLIAMTAQERLVEQLSRTGVSRRAFVLGGVGVALGLAGCGSSTSGGGQSSGGPPRRGGTLIIARGQEIDGWDPDGSTNFVTNQTNELVIEPMLRFSDDGRSVVGGIAQSWEYDPKAPSYTFRLHPDAAFSDGKPVTTDDIAFSVEQWKAGPNFGIVYAGIQRVRALDRRTVRLDLAAPDSTIPVVLSWSMAAVMPKDFGGKTRQEYIKQPIGAGPFTLEKWLPGSETVLKRNRHFYAKGRPYVDGVTIKVVQDPNQRVLAFNSGDTDLVEYLPLDLATQFPPEDVKVAPPHTVSILVANSKKPPFDDIELRRALRSAIDFGAIVDAFPDLSVPPQGIMPINVHNAVPGTHAWEYDLAEAKRHVAASGGFGGDVELIYDASSGTEKLLASSIQADLAAIGAKLKIVGLDTGAHIQKLYGGDFQLGLWFLAAISPDVIDPIGFVLATGWDTSGLDTTQLSKDYADYTEAASDAEQQAVVRRIEDEAYERVPYVPLRHVRYVTAVKPEVQGLKVAPWGMYYIDTIWLDR
jgi:peptide/nickel transport system substrate-binding protein